MEGETKHDRLVRNAALSTTQASSLERMAYNRIILDGGSVAKL